VESGGAESGRRLLSVTGSGNTTATGFVSGKFHDGIGNDCRWRQGAAAERAPAIACASRSCVRRGVLRGADGDAVTGATTTGTLATLSYPNTHTKLGQLRGGRAAERGWRVTTAT